MSGESVGSPTKSPTRGMLLTPTGNARTNSPSPSRSKRRNKPNIANVGSLEKLPISAIADGADEGGTTVAPAADTKAQNDLCFPKHGAERANLAFNYEEGGRKIPTIATVAALTGNRPSLKVETAFIGAVLCDCVRIDKFLLAGGFGRGWAGTLTDRVTGKTKPVFVKTLGILDSDRTPSEPEALRRHRKDCEYKARVEAAIYMHSWFPRAVDHTGAASARLCYGTVKFPKPDGTLTKSYGEIFFICGELCEGGELWSFSVHKKHFEERFAKRIFGQLARGIMSMKHCGDPEPPSRNESTRLAGKLNKKVGAKRVNGCFHRDLKLENLIVSGEYDVKIMDYGSLKFTDATNITQQETADGGVVVNTKTGWVGTECFRPPSFFYTSQRVIESEGYDPAAWDVWSAGVILLFLVGADHIYSKIRGKVYRFMQFALAERDKKWHEGSRQHREWLQYRSYMNNANLFYDTDSNYGAPVKVDKDGIPIVERHGRDGTPLYKRFWEWMDQCDPDANIPTRNREPFSPELKDLLNRMFDVDPRKRITIEEICDHPWLQSHQCPDPYVPVEHEETEEQRQAYLAEMRDRTLKFVDSNERSYIIKYKGSFDEACKKIQLCLEHNHVAEVFEQTDPTMLAAGSLGRIIVRALQEDSEGNVLEFRVFTIAIFHNQWTVAWAHDLHGTATLGEWHTFIHALEDVIEGKLPAHHHDPKPESETTPKKATIV